jgi:hypothetical protein
MSLGRIEPCRPLTRRPGAWAPLPGSDWKVQLFPTQIRLLGPQGQRLIQDLPVQGAVRTWTAQLDLDRHEIRLWGEANSYFCATLRAKEQAIHLTLGRQQLQQLILVEGVESWAPTQERLQFGNHSVQDVDKLGSNLPLSHVVPTWFRLGISLPRQQAQPQELSLLGLLAQKVEEGNRSGVGQAILQNRRAAFQDLWAPQAVDHGFWGFGIPPTLQDDQHLMSAGAWLLRDMVLKTVGFQATLLPCLPKELPAGRLLRAAWPEVGSLEIEWTRGRPRQVLLTPSHAASIQLHWQEGAARLRPLKEQVPVRSEARSLRSGEKLEVVPGRPLLLDRFV